jgi:mRNA turnover protein 4
MPKSKRSKAVSLTKTQGKGRALKLKVVENIRACVDSYKLLFVFTYENMRTSFFKELRAQFRSSSRFFMGKNSVMRMALGHTTQDEYAENLNEVSAAVDGNVGLLFTNSGFDDVTKFFGDYTREDFARCGCIAPRTVEILEGPIDQFPSKLEQLRLLGLPVKINNGKLEMLKTYRLATEGKPITAEGAKLLKHFNEKLATFAIKLKVAWRAEDGAFIAID